ncbi:S49 family peptidase [Bartonella sp. TP]|uniref:S49 family peptidase n=1 Tax=Bartonella sp. TP TaxID=3057550 RepID=UPI0025B07333|nr:S49 family peptidase [Bartonella sp. TP]WJW80214.1 S49 family peptidase [Bartonella sp. TP]
MLNVIKKIIPSKFRSKRIEIPAIRLYGVIAANKSPLSTNLSLEKCATMIEKAFSYNNSSCVVILINSPGGSPVQSHLIFKRLRRLAEEKKKTILMFVEDAAASGGYMIACAGDEIYADECSIIGSIGVVSASFGFVDLIKKLGVERRIYKAGKNKVSLDPFLPEQESDVSYLKTLQLEVHQHFIDLVRKRRGNKLVENDELFTGLFWTGTKAQELGLIDGIGEVSTIIKQRYGEAACLKLITPPKNFLGRNLNLQILSEITSLLRNKITENTLWTRLGL